MSGELVAAARTLIEWLKSPWKLLTTVFLISTFALVAPKGWLKTIGMLPWIEHYWPWLMVVSSGSGVFLVLGAGETIIKPIIQRRKEAHAAAESKHKLERIFRSLVTDETDILAQYSGGHSTVQFTREQGPVQNLVKKGILDRVTGGNFIHSYSLTEEVISYLEANHFNLVSDAVSKAKGTTR